MTEDNSNQEPNKNDGFPVSGCLFLVAGIAGMIALFSGITAASNTQGWGDVGSAVISQVALPVTILALIAGLISRTK
jgi:ABC-type dipeptide/oligopeptide/nickel transport system permease component